MKKWTPHNYQLTALSFLLTNPRSGLFLDPGLGKTSTSLAAIKILKYAQRTRGVLMVAPLRVAYSVWPREIRKWSNFQCLSHTILHENTKNTLWGEHKDIYLINPEGLEWLHTELLKGLRAGKKCPFNTLWVDESTKFKTYGSNRFEYINNMLPLFNRRHIMTGTPAPKGLLDLWSQIYILDEGETLGVNYHEFRRKHFETNDWNKYAWKIKDFAEDIIHKLVAPLVLEMAAEDYLDIPKLSYNDIMVQLPTKAMKHYKRMEKEFFIELDGLEASAEAAAQVSMKCHQIANGNVYEDIPEGLDEDEEKLFRKTRKVIPVHKAKLEALQDLIDELNGKPLLIAYKFKHDLAAIRSILGDDVPHIGSGVSMAKSEQLEDDWNAGKLDYLVCHPSSVAHGLNFQEGGHDVCWYSLTWSLEDYIQLIKRLHRQGVKAAVRCHHLIAEGTIDEAILLRLGEHAKEQQDLRDAIKKYRMQLLPA